MEWGWSGVGESYQVSKNTQTHTSTTSTHRIQITIVSALVEGCIGGHFIVCVGLFWSW